MIMDYFSNENYVSKSAKQSCLVQGSVPTGILNRLSSHSLGVSQPFSALIFSASYWDRLHTRELYKGTKREDLTLFPFEKGSPFILSFTLWE